MKCKRSVLAFALVLVLGALTAAGCAPLDTSATSAIATTPVEQTVEVVATVAVEVTPEGTVDMEFAMALDAALAYVVAHYGEQAPPRSLAWTTELDTLAGLVGSMAYRYVAGDWVAEGLDEVVASVRNEGGEIMGVQGNIADRETAEGLVETAVKNYGRIDVLCNNAGVMDHNHGVGELTDDMWRRVMGINLDGPMFATRKAVGAEIGPLGQPDHLQQLQRPFLALGWVNSAVLHR